MPNTCSTEKGCCETETNAADCGCPTQNPNICPAEFVTEMWKKAFREALYQAKVETLKEKIKKSWGAKFDKGADIVLESMEAQWSAMLAKGKAEADLKEKIKQSMQEKR